MDGYWLLKTWLSANTLIQAEILKFYFYTFNSAHAQNV